MSPAAAGLAEAALLVLMGLGSGVFVGTAFVAFLNALQMPARLAALTYTRRAGRVYELAIAGGCWAAAVWLPFPFFVPVGPWVNPLIGVFTGAFIGMLASALAETIGVMPLLARRTGLRGLVGKVIWAVAAGKIVGTLVQFTSTPFTK